MTARRTEPAPLFEQPREAFAWLTSRWSAYLIAVMVWVIIALDTPVSNETAPPWSQIATTLTLLGLTGLNLWGYWVSSDVRPRVRAEVPGGASRWLDRDRVATERAATKLGWAANLTTWATRGLLLLAVVATLVGATTLAVRLI